MNLCDKCKIALTEDEYYSGDDGTCCTPCRRDIERQAALDAGIPLSVVNGETKLRDHFPQSYIDAQCGRGVRS